MRRLLLFVIGLVGCTPDDSCDTAVDVCESATEGEDYSGTVLVKDVGWSCCDADSNEACDTSWYWYDIFTEGVPATASLTILEAGIDRVWTESHLLPSVDRDPDRFWDNRYVELSIADTQDCLSLDDCSPKHTSGTNTLFPCTDNWTTTLMTWSVSVAPNLSGSGAHCVAWGADPDEFPDCEAWTVSP